MLFIRESACFYLLNIALDGFLYFQIQIDIFFYKFRRHLVINAQHVVYHKNLSVTVNPCANTDGRNGKSLGNFLGQFFRYTFQHQRKSSCFLQNFCVLHDLFGGFIILALHFITAHLVD